MLRRTFMAAAAVATLGAVSIGAALALGPGTYYEYTYFSDPSLTEEVGYASEYCNGSQILMGQAVGSVTSHYTRFPIGSCPGGEY